MTRIAIETFTVAETCHMQYKAIEEEEAAAGVEYGHLKSSYGLETHSAKPTFFFLTFNICMARKHKQAVTKLLKLTFTELKTSPLT